VSESSSLPLQFMSTSVILIDQFVQFVLAAKSFVTIYEYLIYLIYIYFILFESNSDESSLLFVLTNTFIELN